MREFVGKVSRGVDLSAAEAADVARCFSTGQFESESARMLLEAFQLKGYSGEELYAFLSAYRTLAEPLEDVPKNAIDTCGTGGGAPTWNLSTAAAIVAAGAGAMVAKHGNRAVTSKVGSADALEALGVQLGASPHVCWKEAGIAFLFAPSFHPAFRHVGPLRREIQGRTIFNLLGPLLNPALVRRQVVGVFEPAFLDPVADALLRSSAERALVVCGEDGLDEISPTGPTRARIIRRGAIETQTIEPRDFGCSLVDPSVLAPADSAKGNADLILRAISEPGSQEAQAVLPSAAAAVWVAGLADDFESAGDLAREAVVTGKARQALARWVEASNR